MAGPKLGVRQGASTTTRNRGTQGYPVPPEQLADVEPNLDMVEDIVINQIVVPADVVPKAEPTDVGRAARAMDIVTKAILGDIVKEAGEKGEDLGYGFNEEGYPLQDKYEFQSMPIAIENSKGSTRKWYDKDGKEKGATKMHYDYGYVEGVTGADGEPIDVYVGKDEGAEFAFVVHQQKKPDFTEYDEDKVMLGFKSEEDAKAAYLKQYDDAGFYGGMSSMPVEKFKEKLSSGGKITNEGALAENESEGGLPAEIRMHIMRVIHGYKDKLKARGCAPGSEIGKGSNGIAYDCGGGKVLKVTSDDDEAAASMKIRGKKLKHVVHITDVFRFPGKKLFKTDADQLFGVVQEKLRKIDTVEAVEFSQMGRFLSKVDHFWELSPPEEFVKKLEETIAENPEMEKNLRWAFERAKYFQVFEMSAELKSHGIEWVDMHPGNIMKRGNDYVAIDLGASDVDAPPNVPVLESRTFEQAVTEVVQNLLWEARADQVGVTTGRFQPFHRGHAALIRELTSKFDRIIVIVGGLKKDERNPFSFKLRERMIKDSIPDVISKVEIHEAKFQGKNSGFVPGILSEIIKRNDSALKADTGIHILVGKDKVSNLKSQLAQAAKMRQDGEEIAFDPTMADVTTIPDVDEDGSKVSGAEFRKALEVDDREAVSKMVDPHLLSNQEDFDQIYDELRDELGVRKVQESIAQAGGLRAIENTIDQFQTKLINHKPYPINWPNLKELGHGEDGYAYDMGGSKVFKVTTEKTEAISSNDLKGETLKHVVRIFDVFKFPPSEGNQGSRVPLYGIVTEKLTEMSSDEKAEFKEAIGWVMDPAFKKTTRQKISRGDFEGAIRDMEQHMIRLFQAGEIEEALEPTANARVGGQRSQTPASQSSKTQPPGKVGAQTKTTKMDPEQAQAAAKRKVAVIRTMLEHFNIDQICKELAGKGINFFDYHDGNLMKRGSIYVINDLGRSASKGGEPPLLEKMVEEIVEAFSGPGNAAVGVKAGKSAWSTFSNRTDPETEELWQNQLKGLNVQVGSKALPEAYFFHDLADDDRQKLSQAGVDVPNPEQLGSGNNGAVYALSDAKVLKLTRDQNEITVAKKIRGKKSKHVVSVFDVIPLSHGAAIVSERVTPLPNAERTKFDQAMKNIWIGPVMFPYAKGNWKFIVDKANEQAQQRARNDCDGDKEYMKELHGHYSKNVQLGLKFLEDLGLPGIIAEMHALGLRYTDYKGDNMGRRGQDLVVLDLGGPSRIVPAEKA